ncbi:MAG: TatD family deoxyribonuclease [Verrucomicrobia bacterium]|nr:MAG: TatD family deoxyribonuclease [Verrucomicrobiota bacterium]
MWIDSHNHLHDARLSDPPQRIKEMRKTGISGCMVNATQPSDWRAVLSLREAFPTFIQASLGVHPWHAGAVGEGWGDDLIKLLENNPVLSIGECGLDMWVQSPPIEQQISVFGKQLEIANRLDRAVTIHCLKAWQPLLDCFEKCGTPRRFLMHSFGGSQEMAERLLDLGAFFSFSGYYLEPRKTKVLDVFRKLPLERILLETDAPDMSPPAHMLTHPLPDGANHPANLAAIARALADARCCDPAELAAATCKNHCEVFGAFVEN